MSMVTDTDIDIEFLGFTIQASVIGYNSNAGMLIQSLVRLRWFTVSIKHLVGRRPSGIIVSPVPQVTDWSVGSKIYNPGNFPSTIIRRKTVKKGAARIKEPGECRVSDTEREGRDGMNS
jgi:hypothetical protein